MKKIKHLVLLMALLISAINFAQVLTGHNCSVAVSIPGSGTTSTIDQQTTNGWLSFTAQSNQVTFNVHNISNGSTFGKITKVNLYDGSCSNLSLIATNSININDAGAINFNNVNLIAGNTYFLETEKSFNGSQCPSGACTDNAFFNVSFAAVVCPLACGWNWGANTPTLTSSANNYFTFSGFEGACFVVKSSGLPPNNTYPNYQNLNLCEVNICNNGLFVGYSECAGGLGSGVLQNYTIYVFPPSPAPVYSVVVSTATTLLTFSAIGSYTIAGADGQCSPPPVLPNPTLTPTSPELCSCTQLVVNYLGTPNCNISFSPTPICSGQPFCFYNPIQNPPQFTTSIGIFQPNFSSHPTGCHPGLGAGTYTAKAEVWILDKNNNYVPGCYCRRDVPFTVTETPQILDITATPAAGCIGETTTLSAFATGANSYTWLPGPLNSNPVTVTITANQTYTVIAGNSGCTATSAVNVFTLDCCKNPNAGAITLKNVTIVPYNPSSTVTPWGAFGPSATYANMSVQAPGNGIISGNYTVDGFLNVTANNILIRTANIYFTEGALVRQFQTMTIERSYLHGCLYMWRGIRSYAQLTIQSSIMEDAQNAIFPFVVNHAGIYLENNIFNINFNVVNAQGQNFATQGNNPKFYTAGNIFTSKTLPASIYTGFTATTNTYVLSIAPNLNSYAFQALKGSTLLAIPSNITANHGIILGSIVNSQSVRVGEITPGNSPQSFTANALKTNYFNLLKHGVEVTNSRVNIFNCVFDNFFTGSGPAVAGVYHSGGRTQVGQPIGFGKSKCVFNRCNYGVYATNSGTLISQNNTYNLDRRSNGIEFFGGPNSLVTIINNTLTNSQLDLYSFSNANTARIVFDQNIATGTYTTGSRRHHVFINELSTASSPTYVVTTNTLTGKDIGVFMNGVNRSNIVGNIITTNILTLLNNTFYNGVEISNSADTWINDNIITNAASNINMNTFVEGINSNLTTNNTYACNTIYNTGVSMLFRGTSPSNIYKNLLNVNPTAPCKYGIMLDNSGFTGDIKYQPTNGQSGNQFGDFDYSNGGFDTYAQGNSNGSVIYYNGSNVIGNPFNPWLNSFLVGSSSYSKTTTTQPNFWQCGAGIQGIISNGIPPFFTNNLNFNSNTANAMLIGRKGIHHFFKHNAVNTNNIAGANTFMASCANNCIGSLYDIDSLASSQNTVDVQSAQGLNNSFNANNIVEQTQKDFNALYCSFKLNGNSLNASEVVQLTSIAQQCPFTDGASVYQARALLTYFDSTEYVNACEQNLSAASREAEYVDNTVNNSYLALRTVVYPNPAKEELFIETEVENTTLIVYSITGQIVLNEKVSGTNSKFNIEKLNNGTYLYKIIDANGQLIKSDKLIINK